jgi:hypothetical protein
MLYDRLPESELAVIHSRATFVGYHVAIIKSCKVLLISQ